MSKITASRSRRAVAPGGVIAAIPSCLPYPGPTGGSPPAAVAPAPEPLGGAGGGGGAGVAPHVGLEAVATNNDRPPGPPPPGRGRPPGPRGRQPGVEPHRVAIGPDPAEAHDRGLPQPAHGGDVHPVASVAHPVAQVDATGQLEVALRLLH